eukprot:m.343793 g.343793  ORF g.343793 m.343793 type:complete len:489 (-) comp23315_c0_seq1:108-1574(-)
MFVLVVTTLSCLAYSNLTCNITVDSKDPRHGLVRAGDDFHCSPLPGVNNTLSGCMEQCCEADECLSFSWNAPWTLQNWNGCISGENCCCLKNKVPPLETNSWSMNITTGTVTRPPVLCVDDNVCCSLNGELTNNGTTCSCYKGWRGFDCGELDLAPVDNIDGCFQTKVNIKDCDTNCGPSSWGGLPMQDGKGVWHLFASRFVNNCTLAGWNPGSTVVRATSKNPMGPFVYQETVFNTFHHNPTVRLIPKNISGMGADIYMMLMIGDNVSPPSGVGAKCTKGAPLDVHHLEGYIKMAWSYSLEGPWNYSHHTMVTPGSVDDWDAMVTNPSALIMADGTSYIFYRGTQWPANGYERIGFAKATSWKGPYGRPFGKHDPLWDANDQGAFVEDPVVWEDSRGNYHLISHGHWDENGYLAFAQHPEGPWYFRHKPTYTNVLTLTNGTNITMVQRERPQLLFDSNRNPTILYTGVAPPGAAFYGYTYTHAQKIN